MAAKSQHVGAVLEVGVVFTTNKNVLYCEAKTLISRQITPADQFLTPDSQV